jgi:cellobiose-specific phosphotransferase system component IIC
VPYLTSMIKNHFALKALAFTIAALSEAVIIWKPMGLLSKICGFVVLPGGIPGLFLAFTFTTGGWSIVAVMLGVAILLNSVIYYYFFKLVGRAIEELHYGNSH